ncbi:MAG: mechanosensitive ion channel family protein [Bacteroidales bacterium]|nr:mechanosensitive ion channel family protein [Bacteroidales bacterium]
MGLVNNLHKRCISSNRLGAQIFGALIKWRPWAFWSFVLGVIPVTFAVSRLLSPDSYIPFYCFLGLNLAVWLTVKVCHQLTEVFSLRKNEDGITWCYILLLIAILLWILGFVWIFNIMANEKIVVGIGVIGSLLALIFQERIRGALAFFHLRMNHLLNIGDWIVVHKYNADGEVKRITLTTVTIYNWDTTTSSIPISALHTDHFINLQRVEEGKTYGRRMTKSFILDTSWFRPLSLEECNSLRDRINKYNKEKMNGDGKGKDSLPDNIPLAKIEDGMLNAQLFRIYFYHWLMNNEFVSQYPHLMVRWKDHVEGGMPLEVYAFITKTGMVSFEYHQSLIIEHFIESLDWFGLKLYQEPSTFDAGNKKVFISPDSPSHKKEISDEV